MAFKESLIAFHYRAGIAEDRAQDLTVRAVELQRSLNSQLPCITYTQARPFTGKQWGLETWVTHMRTWNPKGPPEHSWPIDITLSLLLGNAHPAPPHPGTLEDNVKSQVMQVSSKKTCIFFRICLYCSFSTLA